jgi:hypothetical protein
VKRKKPSTDAFRNWPRPTLGETLTVKFDHLPLAPSDATAMPVHVLLFDAGSNEEGIHSIELGGRTVVLLFEDAEDAERYAGLLEAQDFPLPSVERIHREDVELFCAQAGYEARFVPAGFLPKSEEDRLLIAPPPQNLDVHHWKDGDTALTGEESTGEDPELEAFRRRLEGLL